MMKSRIIIIAAIVLATFCATAQEWIGRRFTLDTIVNIQGNHAPKDMNPVKCAIQDNTFYFVEQQGFQYKENDHHAVIHALRLDNYEQAEIAIPAPDNARNIGQHARDLWIYDFSFSGDYLLVTTQDVLILYKKFQNQNYRVESTYRHHNLYMAYLHQNKIHFFEEDHDKGFKWFQQKLGSDTATLVRELPYEAPHTVQIQPNRYISHNSQSVLFLSTRFPRMEAFTLDGRHLETVTFDLPAWKAFEDDYIQKTLSIPYGIERIYAVKDDLYDYSYPKVVMPLRGDFLLLYMQFDTLIGKSALQYALREESGQTIRYLRKNHDDRIYTAAQFPFTLFQGGFDKGNAAGDGKIVQLTYRTEIPWEGKKPDEYASQLDNYFAEQSPTLAYKVMRYQPHGIQEIPTLYPPAAQEPISLGDLPAEQSILLLHQGLECSGCVKALYALLNQTADSIHVGHVYPTPLTGMSAHELRGQIRQHLDRPFSLYSNPSPFFRALTPSDTLTVQDFPCLLLYRKNEAPILVKLSEIFATDISIAFSEKFLEKWNAFLSESRSLND